jgi:spore coat polysaccharide biosynthesis predicted glycosyltransferase SpsG
LSYDIDLLVALKSLYYLIKNSNYANFSACFSIYQVLLLSLPFIILKRIADEIKTEGEVTLTF